MPNESVTLIQPCLLMKEEYIRYCLAFRSVNEADQDMDELALRDFAQFIQAQQDAELGKGLPASWVSCSTYWLVRDGGFILGNSSLRHFLTPDLEDLGGHIGYRINPLERRKGYGTLILKLTLEKARERGLTEVLVTCDPINIASARVIQNNGGVLASESYSQKYSRMVSRYWIKL